MKKKLLSFLLAFILLATLIAALPTSVSASSSGVCGDALRWDLDDEGTLIISGSGAMYNWDYYSNAPWYSSRENINSVIIDSGVTSIGDRAFNLCWNLTSITITDSVTSIGNSAFYECRSLKSVTIPNNVTCISYETFNRCFALTSVTIGNSVTSIGKKAFSECVSLTSVTIPDSVESIGERAFDKCYRLTSIKIPDSVTSIGEYAFYGCNSLTSVTIPDSVTSIERYAFAKCSSLTSITIPESVTYIGVWVFGDCNNLTDVHYLGSKEQWKNINICSDNECLINANIHYISPININYIISSNGSVWETATAKPSTDFTLTTNTPTRTGHTFLGWSTTANAAEAKYQPGDTITAGTEDISLYAVWEKKTYTETKKANGIFMVTPADVPTGSSIMLACYKGGVLVHIENFEYDGSAAVSFSVNTDYDNVKVFVWNNADGMVPVTETEDVNL